MFKYVRPFSGHQALKGHTSTMIVLGAFQSSFKAQIQTRITFNNDTITLYRCKMSPKLEGLYRKDF